MLLRSYIHEQKESSGIVTFGIPGINVDMSLTYLQGLFEFIEILLLVYSNFYTDSFHGMNYTSGDVSPGGCCVTLNAWVMSHSICC